MLQAESTTRETSLFQNIKPLHTSTPASYKIKYKWEKNLDTLNQSLPQNVEDFENAAELWGSISSITYDRTVIVFRKRRRKNAHCIDADGQK